MSVPFQAPTTVGIGETITLWAISDVSIGTLSHAEVITPRGNIEAVTPRTVPLTFPGAIGTFSYFRIDYTPTEPGLYVFILIQTSSTQEYISAVQVSKFIANSDMPTSKVFKQKAEIERIRASINR